VSCQRRGLRDNEKAVAGQAMKGLQR